MYTLSQKFDSLRILVLHDIKKSEKNEPYYTRQKRLFRIIIMRKSC